MRITTNTYYTSNGIAQPNSPVFTALGSLKKSAPDAKLLYDGLHRVVLDKLFAAAYNPVTKMPNFSKEEYNALSPFELKVLRNRYNHMAKSYPHCAYVEAVHDIATDAIKSGLDKKYGEDKYKVVIVGRSLSSIGKVLGYKIGEDRVLNVALSDMGADQYKNQDKLISLKKKGGLKKFTDYLAKAGLNKEDVKNSDKKIVIMDYCCSGDSLKGATNLFKCIYDDSTNIVSENPLDLSHSPAVSLAVSRMLVASTFKNISFVKHCKDLDKSALSVVDPQKESYEKKLMWFKLLDNTMVGRKFKCDTLDGLNNIILGKYA